jgi:hypothetical protein
MNMCAKTANLNGKTVNLKANEKQAENCNQLVLSTHVMPALMKPSRPIVDRL